MGLAKSNIVEKVSKYQKSLRGTDVLQCNGITDCAYLMRLKRSFDALESECNAMESTDDFLHLLESHDDDEQFKYIHNALGGSCDITKCVMFRRNYRHRDDDEVQTDAKQQIADKIHCYSAHSYDIGFRLRPNTEESKEDSDDIAEPNPSTARLNIKYNQLKQKQNDETQSNAKKYNFGVLFRYNYKNEKVIGTHTTVKPKYKSFKEELTKNDLHTINPKQFENEHQKAVIHFNSQFRRENPKWKAMSIEHILSLIIYCNYDGLQNTFSKTYFIKEYIAQHNSFYHFGKLLKISVNTFGTALLQWKLYHGISEPLSFPGLFSVTNEGVRIYAPLSTTTDSYEVAVNFTNFNRGLVVQFGHSRMGISTYFKLRWSSDFPAESELY